MNLTDEYVRCICNLVDFTATLGLAQRKDLS